MIYITNIDLISFILIIENIYLYKNKKMGEVVVKYLYDNKEYTYDEIQLISVNVKEWLSYEKFIKLKEITEKLTCQKSEFTYHVTTVFIDSNGKITYNPCCDKFNKDLLNRLIQ